MAFSENLASFDHWNFCPLTDPWISEAFSRETETLTKAIQQSLSSASETVTDNKDPYLMNLIIKPDPSPTGSGSDHDAFSSKRRNSIRSNGKIVKRKSRATKGTPTTFITADPSNFRQMVQQVTGIRLGNSHVPVNHVLKPEPQRPGGNRIQNCSLPTFDTSTFFIETNSNNNNNQLHQHLLGPTNAATTQAHVSFEPVTHGGVGLDLDTSRSFPTLESWRLM